MEPGSLFVGEEHKAQGALGAPVTHQAGQLQHAGHTAGVVVGAGRRACGVVMSADDDDLVGPRAAGDLHLDILEALAAAGEAAPIRLIAKALQRVAYIIRRRRVAVRSADMARPDITGELLDVLAESALELSLAFGCLGKWTFIGVAGHPHNVGPR